MKWIICLHVIVIQHNSGIISLHPWFSPKDRQHLSNFNREGGKNLTSV